MKFLRTLFLTLLVAASVWANNQSKKNIKVWAVQIKLSLIWKILVNFASIWVRYKLSVNNIWKCLVTHTTYVGFCSTVLVSCIQHKRYTWYLQNTFLYFSMLSKSLFISSFLIEAELWSLLLNFWLRWILQSSNAN